MPSELPPGPQLKRTQRGLPNLVAFTIAASAPMTVLAGGVTTTFAVTGNAGVPLSFVILALALALFVVGYAAMARYVANAGGFYSYVSAGLGGVAGVSSSFVALLGYNAIQIGLYGLFGAAMQPFAESTFGLALPWWAWAVAALIVVGLFGISNIDLSANVLGVLLVAEIIAVVLYDIGAFGHPAGGVIPTAPLSPATLFVPGVGAVFAFSVAAFVGFESGATYAEEVANPRVTVARATFIALAVTGLLYAVSAWAMTAAVGVDQLQQAATANGPGLVFSSLGDNFGAAVADIANILFLTSVFAALLSFHNNIARYLFALGREQVLPSVLAWTGSGTETRQRGPVAGSLVQSVVALVVVVVFAIAGADPLLQLFTWFSGMSAVAVILLMAGTSAAAVGYFRRHPTRATRWSGIIAPSAATVVLAALVVLLVANFYALLGTDPTSPLRWIFPGLVLLAAVAGAALGSFLKRNRRDIYDGIGLAALAPDAAEASAPGFDGTNRRGVK